MDPVSLLENWLAPITNPLKDFRSQIEEISNIHQSSINTFQNQVNTLTDTSSPDAMTGPGADAISLSAENYTSTELTVSDIEGTISSISNASGLCNTAVTDILEAVSNAGLAASDTEVLGEITAAVDVSAAVQGGLDVPDDIAAGALTSITMQTIIAGLIALAIVIAGIIWIWRSAMDALSGSFQHSQLPEKPQPIKPLQQPVNQLNADDILQELKRQGIQADRADIEALIKLGYDKKSIIDILKSDSQGFLKYAKTKKLTSEQIKDITKAISQAQKIIKDAKNGKIKKASQYHGRLSSELEQEILSNPDEVYLTTGSNPKYMFRKGNNVVITGGPGSGRGAIITSYGPDGPRGESGASIYGGNPSDPGMPVTDSMIRNGKIPIAGQSGDTFPPAIPITPNENVYH